MTIKIGILGYGNLGKGVECAVKHNPDMELAAVFTRRDKASLKVLTPGVKVCSVQEAESMKDEIDVMILCGGSATDLPVQTPELAKNFHVVDSFDTHARIPEHFEAVDAAANRIGMALTDSPAPESIILSLRQNSTAGCEKWRKPGADYKAEAYERVLCGGGRRG